MNFSRILKWSPFIALTLLNLSAVLSSARADEGGMSGGGGSVVELPDDTVVLADPYVQRIGTYENLRPELVQELRLVQRLVGRYGWVGDFFSSKVFGPAVEYRFVSDEEMAQILLSHPHCREQEQLPSGINTQIFGCTQGDYTWLRDSAFRRMNIREQAQAIIHERLHVAVNVSEHIQISDIVSALEILVGTYRLQIAGERPTLTPEQMSAIETFRRRVLQFGFSGDSNLSDFVVTPQGGLEYRRGRRTGGYIGIGSIYYELWNPTGPRKNFTLIESHVSNCELGDGVLLFQSRCYDNRIGNRTVMIRSRFPSHVEVGEDVILLDTVIEGGAGKIAIEDGVRLSRILFSMRHIRYVDRWIEVSDRRNTMIISRGTRMNGNGHNVCEGRGGYVMWRYFSRAFTVSSLEELRSHCHRRRSHRIEVQTFGNYWPH